MSIIIIEDELQARLLIKMLINKHFASSHIIGEAVSIHQGIELINKLKPDIVLLDIQLSDGNSFEILNHVSYKDFKIIFITSYSDYAIKAFKFGAVHYLLKPYSEDDFIEAMSRISIETNVQASFENTQKTLDIIKQNKQLTSISIPTIKGFEIFNISEMIYFEAIPGQISLECTNKRKVRINKTLSEYEELLIENNFERVHKSFLINTAHILNYEFNNVGGVVKMTDGKEIPVARRKKAVIVNLLNNKKQ